MAYSQLLHRYESLNKCMFLNLSFRSILLLFSKKKKDDRNQIECEEHAHWAWKGILELILVLILRPQKVLLLRQQWRECRKIITHRTWFLIYRLFSERNKNMKTRYLELYILQGQWFIHLWIPRQQWTRRTSIRASSKTLILTWRYLK